MLPVFPPEWDIQSTRLIANGLGGKVWRVERNAGSAIVKAASAIAVDDLRRGADFLSWRGGCGAVRLFGCSGTLSLLEYGGERSLLGYLDDHGDEPASRIAAQVLVELHEPVTSPRPPNLQPLRDHFASLFAKADADRPSGAATIFTEAAAAAEQLLSDQRRVRPLHGDLHHENIVFGPRGWLALDPKGLVGDPAYDAANLFYNPLARDDLRTDQVRIARLAEILAKALGRDMRTVLGYAFCHACLAASWHLEDGNAEEAERSRGVAEAVREVWRSSE